MTVKSNNTNLDSQFSSIFTNEIQWDDDKQINYSPNGVLLQGDCLKLLAQVPKNSIDVIFCDPPYNIGKLDTHWDEFQSEDDYLDWCLKWMTLCYKVLQPSGSLFVMGFSEILAKILAFSTTKEYSSIRWLIWHYRNKARLRNTDWVRSHESILHLRKTKNFRFNSDAIREPYNHHTTKYPERSHGRHSQFQNSNNPNGYWWHPNSKGAKPRDVINLPALNNKMKEKTPHPTQKPEALLRRLIMGVAPQNGIILDPFAGSGTSSIVAEQMGLSWIACELHTEYIELIVKRIKNYRNNPKPLSYYLNVDLKQSQNRSKIK